MEYITIKEAAKKWGVSEVVARKYCRENRIPGAKPGDKGWEIPKRAKKPEKLPGRVAEPYIPPLAKKLIHQKTKKNYHGLYDSVVTDLTYSSCRLASNRLTWNQVDSIFRKGKVEVAFEPMKVSDCIEVQNHIFCVDFIIDRVGEPLTERLIAQLHYQLTVGTIDHRKGLVTPGVYRDKDEIMGKRPVPRADEVDKKMEKLIREYEKRAEIGMREILDFHVQFEKIAPFEDYNGRLGRLLMFKECLRKDVMPFIIDDKRRRQYLDGLKAWDTERMPLKEVAAATQERFAAMVDQRKLGEYRRGNYGNPSDGEEDWDDDWEEEELDDELFK